MSGQKRKIEVFALHCNSNNQNAERPAWFKKEKIFKNLLSTKDDDVNITIFFDGDPNGHFVAKYGLPTVVLRDGKSGARSLRGLYQYINTLDFSDDTIIYIVEDDFTHRKGWPDILREAFDGSMKPTNLRPDYVTLYDHLDKYFHHFYVDLVSKVGYTKSVHWRTVPSTVNTVATRFKTFKEDFPILLKWCCVDEIYPYDHKKFLELGERGRVLVSCMPAWSTHTQVDVMAPCVDWASAVGEQ